MGTRHCMLLTRINGQNSESVEKFVDLGCVVSVDGGVNVYFVQYINSAKFAFVVLSQSPEMYPSQHQLAVKLMLFCTIVLSMLLFGNSVSKVGVTVIQRLRAFVNSYLRRVIECSGLIQ